MSRSIEFKVGGEGHRVFRKGNKIYVDHIDKNGGKWDKINLTSQSGASTLQEGVQAVKDWHRKNG
jgi:hypothetical protein